MIKYDAELDDEEIKNVLNNVFDSETAKIMDSFNDNVNEYQSSYDTWISSELEEYGVEQWRNVYFNYLSFWEENEYRVAIESGEKIFVNSDEYEQWESSVEQLMNSSKILFNCEHSILILDGLRAYIVHCDLIRQQVICQKIFIYYQEYQQAIAQGVLSPQITIQWATK